MKKPMHAAKPHIAEGVGVVARSGVPGLGAAMEAAMSQAVLDCAAEGITDPAEIRERMKAAQEEARVDFEAAVADFEAANADDVGK